MMVASYPDRPEITGAARRAESPLADGAAVMRRGSAAGRKVTHLFARLNTAKGGQVTDGTCQSKYQAHDRGRDQEDS
jgi:hypothetical protein